MITSLLFSGAWCLGCGRYIPFDLTHIPNRRRALVCVGHIWSVLGAPQVVDERDDGLIFACSDACMGRVNQLDAFDERALYVTAGMPPLHAVMQRVVQHDVPLTREVN